MFELIVTGAVVEPPLQVISVVPVSPSRNKVPPFKVTERLPVVPKVISRAGVTVSTVILIAVSGSTPFENWVSALTLGTPVLQFVASDQLTPSQVPFQVVCAE